MAAAAPVAKTPTRKRGVQRVNAILNAASEVFVEKGYDAATTAEIAERAGSSIGSLYQFFPTKESLADVLRARYGDDISGKWDALAESNQALSGDELAAALVRIAAETLREHPAFPVLESVHNTALADVAKVRKRYMASLSNLLRSRAPHLTGSELQTAVIVVLQLIRSEITIEAAARSRSRREVVSELQGLLTHFLRQKIDNEQSRETAPPEHSEHTDAPSELTEVPGDAHSGEQSDNIYPAAEYAGRNLVIGERLSSLTREVARGFSRCLQVRITQHGVTIGQYAFLRALWINDGILQRELADRVGLKGSTTSIAINSLERLGYVQRIKKPHCRRGVYVVLTEKGRALEKDLIPVVHEINALATRGLANDDIATLRRGLLKMFLNFQKDEIGWPNEDMILPSNRHLAKLMNGDVTSKPGKRRGRRGFGMIGEHASPTVA